MCRIFDVCCEVGIDGCVVEIVWLCGFGIFGNGVFLLNICNKIIYCGCY